MTTSELSPSVVKGAIVAVDPTSPLRSVVVFQYNPESLSRTLQARTAGGERGTPMRLLGPPEETLKIGIAIDASDQLQRGDTVARDVGVLPTLSALEMLLYPKSGVVIANDVLARVGVIEVIPAQQPLTLLIWGDKRIVPVQITEFSITEEAFDTDLNPIRAKIDLGFRMLTYLDLGLLSPGGALFMAHQMSKEVMATVGSAGTLGDNVAAVL